MQLRDPHSLRGGANHCAMQGPKPLARATGLPLHTQTQVFRALLLWPDVLQVHINF